MNRNKSLRVQLFPLSFSINVMHDDEKNYFNEKN